MKVITLIPVKNEAWILAFSLTNASIFSDEIIVLDDNSTDTTREMASSFEKVKLISYKEKEVSVNMSKRRNLLLEEGRKSGGTHFVFIDADETFSYNYAKNFREKIKTMQPGDTICLPWLLIFQENEGYFYNNKKTFLKDFIFCDDKKTIFRDVAISEERTPIAQGTIINTPLSEGFVLHFQQLAHTRNQYKQIWYRMNELIEGKRSARKINATYDFTKTLHLKNKTKVDDFFSEQNSHLINPHLGEDEPLSRIKKLFNKHGVLFFESLDIWFMNETLLIFKKETGRNPRVKTFPKTILYLNTQKNKLRSFLKS